MTLDLAFVPADRRSSAARRSVTAHGGVFTYPLLRVQSFGQFRVRVGEEEIEAKAWRGQNTRRLLARLLLARGRSVPREQLLGELWPDAAGDAAENSLRVTLSRLHKALEGMHSVYAPPRYIRQDSDGLRCEMELISFDLLALDQALAQAQAAQREGDRTARLAAFERVLELYSGPLLPDCQYEDWSTLERERCIQWFCTAGITVAHSETLICPDRATAIAWRVLEADPTNEPVYQLLMRIKWLAGERTAALRLFQHCRDVLQAQLDVEPCAETMALVQQIRGAQPAYVEMSR